MAPAQPRLLIFEPDPRGHAEEWIEHLLACAATRLPSPTISVVVAEELAARLRDRWKSADRVRIVAISPGEQRFCMHRRLVVSGFARWRTMRRYLSLLNGSHGVFLGFDHVTLPFALGLTAGGPTVTGVLFRPSVHYHVFGGYRPSLKERIRDLRKDVLYRLMLHNRAVHAVLSLDPYFPAHAWARYRDGSKVAALADPAFPPPAASVAEMELVRRVPEGRTAFVLFGELTARKGVLPLLRALALLPHPVAARVAVLIAGRIDPAIRTGVHELVDRVQSERPELWLHVENRRLSNGELAALVRGSDVVLAPYQDFVGSSGILLWAARLRRPVICQAYGLVGQLTRENGLGTTVDSTDPEALAGAIADVARQRPEHRCDLRRMAAFAAAHTPERFAQAILNRALEDATAAAADAWGPRRIVSE